MDNQIIENTEAFKELDSITKIIYRKKQMMDRVKREIEVAREIGMEKYNYIYTPRPYLLKVIKELLNNGY